MKPTFAAILILTNTIVCGAEPPEGKAPPQVPDSPGPLAAPAVPPEDHSRPVNIRVEVQMVAIPERLAFPLIREMKDKAKIQAANDKIQEMLTDGTAQLLGWPIVTTKSGQRAVSQGQQELIRPTSYARPVVSVSQIPVASEAIKVKAKVEVMHLAGIPASFQTESVGVVFEVEPTLEPDGQTIHLNLVPQHVRLNGFRKLTMTDSASKISVVVEQPELDVKKVLTSVALRSGQLMLLGAYPLSDPPKHMELFILKAEVIPIE